MHLLLGICLKSNILRLISDMLHALLRLISSYVLNHMPHISFFVSHVTCFMSDDLYLDDKDNDENCSQKT